MAARIINKLNTSFPIRERQTLIPTLHHLTLKKGQRAVRGITEALNVHITRNERLKTLFVRLEGSLDLKAAEEFINGIKEAAEWVQDKLVIDFKGIQFFSRKAIHLMFVENQNKLWELRGRLRIVNLSNQIPGISDSLNRYIAEMEFLDDLNPTAQTT
jgi:anti-anti-sigma regulatory factor